MSTKLKFQRACKLIPAAENLDTRTFVLSGGDLYFGGDRSWFKIEQFMDSDVDVYLEMKDLNPIISMDGDIVARKGASTRAERTLVTFSNNKHTLNLFCDGVDVIPPKVAVPLLPQKYQALPSIFSRGRNLFPLISDYATAGIVSITVPGENPGEEKEEGYFSVLNPRLFLAMQGDAGLDIDLTDIPEVMGGVISQNAKVSLDKQVVHCMIEEPDYRIFSAFKHANSRFMTKQKIFMSSLAHGSKEKDHSKEQLLVRMSIPVAQMAAAIPVMDKLSHDGYINMEVSKADSKMRLSLIDKVNNTFETFIDCQTTEDVKITCLMIDSSTLLALCTAVGAKMEVAQLKMFMNPWGKYLFIRPEPNPDNVNVFALLKTL